MTNQDQPLVDRHGNPLPKSSGLLSRFSAKTKTACVTATAVLAVTAGALSNIDQIFARFAPKPNGVEHSSSEVGINGQVKLSIYLPREYTDSNIQVNSNDVLIATGRSNSEGFFEVMVDSSNGDELHIRVEKSDAPSISGSVQIEEGQSSATIDLRCSQCNGSGIVVVSSSYKTCPNCNGSGRKRLD